jgi:predicted O-methyltransferase YrrM
MNRWSKPSSLHGIDYDLAEMKACLRTLVETYFAEFEEHVPYEVACKRGFGPGYTRLDAIVLYAMIRAHKPAKYLEVGSGVSTYYAAEAAKLNARDGRPMQVTCIDPNPFSALRSIPGVVIKATEVQDESPLTFEQLGPHDMLFIDSSHIVRLDGDVPFLLLEVLPVLRAGVLIHIHDIPFPYHCPYPPRYWIYDNTWAFWWNESMLLHALLCGNKHFSITLSTPLIRYHDEAFLAALIPGYKSITEEPNTFSSMWLTKCG